MYTLDPQCYLPESPPEVSVDIPDDEPSAILEKTFENDHGLSCLEETGFEDCRERDDDEVAAYWAAQDEYLQKAQRKNVRQVNATGLDDLETTTPAPTPAPTTPAPISNCMGCEDEPDGWYSGTR